MRFSCKSCQATFQTATGAAASSAFRCPSCGGEMAAVAEVVELWQDRVPTRRYDLDDLRARLDLEREESAKARGQSGPRSADQVWFAAVQGRQVGPLSAAGIGGLRTRGQLSAASLVWREGWTAWVSAEAVPELRPLLGLPEETLGRPFPVDSAPPAPPPLVATYRSPPESNEEVASSGAPAPGAARASNSSSGPGAALQAHSPAKAPAGLSAPFAIETRAPPALPVADEQALEAAASMVLAESREGGSVKGAGPDAPLSASHGTDVTARPALSANFSAGAADSARANPDGGESSGSVPVMEFSSEDADRALASGERRDAPPARTSGAQWFGGSGGKEQREIDLRPRLALAMALVVALIALSVLLRWH